MGCEAPGEGTRIRVSPGLLLPVLRLLSPVVSEANILLSGGAGVTRM